MSCSNLTRLWRTQPWPRVMIKQQFGYATVRYRGLAKNTARLQVIFALDNV
ncbi:transposase, IS5 family [Paracidovorax citrulli]|nr:transposase, IS5 family [Paracidovorax citrulli]